MEKKGIKTFYLVIFLVIGELFALEYFNNTFVKFPINKLEKVSGEQNKTITLQTNEVREEENSSSKIKEKLANYFYTGKNESTSNEIAASIIIANEKYSTVPIHMLAAIVRTESDGNPKVIHPLNTQKRKKLIYGVCGIYAYHWVDALKREGIITKESDLEKIRPNVIAAAFIYKTYYAKYQSKTKTCTNFKGSLTSSVAKRQANYLIRLSEKIKKEI